MDWKPEAYTVPYLLRFWKRTAVERFQMNPNTANAIRVACARVLSAVEPGVKGSPHPRLDGDWAFGKAKRPPQGPSGVDPADPGQVDVRHLDVEALKQRFQAEFAGKLSDETIETYKARFQYGLDSYLQFLNDPTGWDPGFAPRDRGIGAPREREIVEGGASLTHRFPLRRDMDAVVIVPRDLSQAEAKRLGAFLLALAGPETDGPGTA